MHNIYKSILDCIAEIMNRYISTNNCRLYQLLIILLFVTFQPVYSLDSNKIIISGSYDYPPYSYLDENGKAAGFSVDLSIAISKVLNKEIKLKLEPWDKVRQDLEHSNTQLIHDIIYSEERSKLYAFSKPYHISPFAIFAKKDAPSIHSIEELKGKKIVVIKGDIGDDYMKEKGIVATIQAVENYADAILLISKGDYQYAIMDQLVGLYWIKATGVDNIEITNIAPFKMKYCYAAEFTNKELVLEIDGALTILIQNGVYEALYRKWMTKIDPQMLSPWDIIRKYFWILIVVIAIIFILFAWSFILRKKVAIKTNDLKIANDSLQESKDRYKALLSANPDMMFMFDKNGIFVDFHGGVSNLLFEPGYFIEKNIYEVLPKEIAKLTQEQLDKAFQSGQTQLYEYQLSIDDKPRDYECRLVLSGSSYALSIVRDITERKYNESLLQRQNQELEAQYEEYMQLNEILRKTNSDLELAKAEAEADEKELSTLMSNLPGIVYRCLNDYNWSMEFVSEGSLLLTGYLPEELLRNNTIAYNDLIHPDDQKYVDSSIQDCIRQQQHYILDYRIICKDGAIKYVWERGQGMYDANGTLYMLQGFITDITDYKQAEDALQKQNQELEAQYEEYMQLNEILRKTNSDLELAKAKAEESDKLKTAFLQNMSHEIRTPLNGIIGYSNLLNNAHILREEIEEYTTIIQQSGNRLIEIVNNVLDISKIETGQIEIHKNIFSLNSLMSDLFNFFSNIAIVKNISLTYHNFSDDENCLVSSDELRVNQILMNLIANALKFTPGGSIDFGYNIDNNEIIFHVKDTGIGISDENQSKIFDRFTQIDLSISRGFEGAGLGLAICKGLVELLGGQIWVKSEANKGSAFYFSIPYDNMTIENIFNQEKSRETFKNIHTKRLKILIAEDDETSENLMALVVKKISREILRVRNGVNAVEVCRANPDIDLILMDIKMPIMNGIDATKQIRAFNQKVIIIAQTAFAFNSEKEMILAAGCNDYLSKPIEINKIIQIIDKYSR